MKLFLSILVNLSTFKSNQIFDNFLDFQVKNFLFTLTLNITFLIQK